MAEQQHSNLYEMKNDVKFVDSTVSEPCDGTTEGSDVNHPLSENYWHKKRNKSSDKIKSTPPRRASKRLAGIKVDIPSQPPTPLECKTRHQATTRWEREAKMSTTTNLVATQKEHDEKAAAETTSREPGRNVDMDNKPQDKQEIQFLSPPENLSTIKETCETVKEKDNKADVRQEVPSLTPSAPVGHEKQIKIHGLPKETQVPTALPVMSLAIPEVTPIVPLVSLEMEMDGGKKGSTVVNPPMSVPIQENNNGGLETDIKCGSPVNFSMKDLWSDPCIEFAVKTLTGEISIGEENKMDNICKSPMEEFWMDPCMDFDVKTLTGAIPVE